MSEVADFRTSRDDALINVDRAHKAVEKINDEIDASIKAATAKINAEFTPVVFEAQSVLYEVMAAACRIGFTYKELREVMDCDGH